MRVNGSKGFDFLLTDFVPLLKYRELGDADIHRMLVTNLATIFSMSANN